MRSNPLVTEVLVGLTRLGKAQLDALGCCWCRRWCCSCGGPRTDWRRCWQSQHGPHTLTAVVMAMGVTMAYFALRAGAEEILLPGQHGLRDWALATPWAWAGSSAATCGTARPQPAPAGAVFTAAVDGLHGVRGRVGRARVVRGGGADPGSVLPAVRGDHAPHHRTASRRELASSCARYCWWSTFLSVCSRPSPATWRSHPAHSVRALPPKRHSRRCRIRWSSLRSMRDSACSRRLGCIACSLRERRRIGDRHDGAGVGEAVT